MLRVLVQVLKIVSVAALTLLVIGAAARFLSYSVSRAVPADIGEPVAFVVGQDDSGEDVAARLEQDGLIRSKVLFEGQLRLTQTGLKPGTYTLRKGMSVGQIVDTISGAEVAQAPATNGGGAAPQTFEITIPEGWRDEQIAEEYEKLGGKGGYDAFMQAIANVDRSQYDFLAGVPADQPLQGFLFPDTYRFAADDPDADVAQMLTNFGVKFDASMRERTKEMQLAIDDVVKIASLVEREAQVPDERPIIADVYLSRWEQGWRMEADPTVQYVLGKRGDWWPKLTGDDLFVASPYNTYQNDGLPPTPIANPGFASLQAVLFPADTPYMYFVAKGDSGEHAFAVTADEQQANIDKYLNTPGSGQ